MTGFSARIHLLLLVSVIAVACAVDRENRPSPMAARDSDPYNTTYTIEDQAISLVEGSFTTQSAPGSATMIEASIFGRPVEGDLDNDGDDDALVVIVYDSGGSGTFYYLAAAINQNGRYRGSRGYLLGDRILVQLIKISRGGVLVRYLDRGSTEPMSAPPTIRSVIRLTFTGDQFIPLKKDVAEEQVLEGWVTIGHEVRSFLPCSNKTDHWLSGNSPALKEIMTAYQQALPAAKPYTPLFMTLAGKFTAAPADGFGADYSAAFLVTRLVRVWPDGNCRREFIVVESPRHGAVIASPLKVRGWARGTWFFEGDFPLILEDINGRVIARGYATARGEWMTKDFVPFEGIIPFKIPATGKRGVLVLKKDNPADRPELDDALELPVYFK